jgi:hypothetical protein
VQADTVIDIKEAGFDFLRTIRAVKDKTWVLFCLVPSQTTSCGED